MTDDRTREGSGRARKSEAPDRIPPHNAGAEASLLGAAILSKPALEILATRLTPGDFYVPRHALIAEVLGDAFANGWPTDAITVAAELERRGWLDQIGGKATLVEIQASTPSTTSAGRYAEIVHGHATLRKLLESAGEITAHVYARPDDPGAAIRHAQDLLGDVASTNGRRGSGSYSTLETADVAALLEGSLAAEDADFLTRNDGRALLYAGKMHVFQAEPTSGKTWIALLAALEVLNLGGAALYLDYEDSSRGILGRLLALGADPAVVRDRFVYVQPIGPFGLTERLELERILARLNPDLVVIDGVAEALARDGLQEDRASEVVGWIEKLPRWLARTGAAVVMLDHVVKDREQQGRWARGSSAKLGAVDGATYVVKVASPFSRHRDGVLKMVIAKDRPGGVGALGEVAAVVKVEPKADGERVVMTLEVDTGERRATDAWKPTVLMRKVSEELERSTAPLTASALKSLVRSDKPKLVAEAIARLIAEGYVRETGTGRSKILRLVKPFHGFGDTPPDLPPPDPSLFDPSIDPETGKPYEVLDEPPSNVVEGPWPADRPYDPDDDRRPF